MKNMASQNDRIKQHSNAAVPNMPPPLGMDQEHVAEDLKRHFSLTLGRDELLGSRRYLFDALALTVRDRLVERSSFVHERVR